MIQRGKEKEATVKTSTNKSNYSGDVDAFKDIAIKVAEDLPEFQPYLKSPDLVSHLYSSHKAALIYTEAVQRYQLARSEGYSKSLSIKAGLLGTGGAALLSKGSTFLVVEGVYAIWAGGEIAVEGAIAGGSLGAAAGPLGSVGGVFLGALPGAATALLGGLGFVIGYEGLKSSKEFGDQLTLAYCKAASQGGYFKAAGNYIKGILYKPNSKSNNLEFKLVQSIVTEQNPIQKAFYVGYLFDAIDKSSLTFEQKQEFHADYASHQSLAEILGLSYLTGDTETLDLVLHPEKILLRKQPEKYLQISDGGEILYRFEAIDKTNSLNLSTNKTLQNFMIQRGISDLLNNSSSMSWSIGSPNFQFGQPNLSTNYNITEKNDGYNLFRKLFDSNEGEIQRIKKIEKNLTLPRVNGKQYTPGQALAELLEYAQDEKKEKESAEKYANKQAVAGLITLIGGNICNKSIETFGIGSSYTIGISHSLLRMAGGDVSPQNILNFATNFFGLIGLSKKKESVDPFQLLFQELRSISEQMKEIKYLIIQLAELIELKFNKLFERLDKRFTTVFEEIYVNRLIETKKLDQIQEGTYQLGLQINKEISGLWLNSLIDARFYLNQYKLRNETLNSLEYEKYTEIATNITSWIFEKSSHDNTTGRNLYYRDITVEHMLTIVKNCDPHDFIGFFISYAQDRLGLVMPGDDFVLCNPNVWLIAVNTYIGLMCEVNPEHVSKWDENFREFSNLFLTGDRIIHFYKCLQQNSRFFEVLLYQYSESLNKVARRAVLTVNEESVGEQKSIFDVFKETEERRKSQILPIEATSGVKVNDHEPAYFQQKINTWDTQYAAKIIPEFFLKYQDNLLCELNKLNANNIDYFQSLPLTLFVSMLGSNDLYPLSVLFDVDNCQVKLPENLLLAEKLQLGQFVFTLGKFDSPVFVGNNNPIKIIDSVNIKVKITFDYKNKTIDIGSVNLVAKKYDSFIYKIPHMTSFPNPKYGEINSHLTLVASVAVRVGYISAWSNATVIKYENFYNEDSSIVQEIKKEISIKIKKSYKNLLSQLEKGIPKAASVGIPINSDYFLDFFDALQAHELNFKLLLVYAKLLGLPGAFVSKLEKLWDKAHIAQLIKNIGSLGLVTTNSFHATVKQHLEQLPQVPSSIEEVASTVTVILSGLLYQPIPGDGHCLFNAIGVYLGKLQQEVRAIIAGYLEQNIEEFREFIESNGGTAENYVKSVRNGGEWGSNIELEIAMRVFNRPIIVIRADGQIVNSDTVKRFNGKLIFVYYNNSNHYDAFILQQEADEQKILANLLAHSAAEIEAELLLEIEKNNLQQPGSIVATTSSAGVLSGNRPDILYQEVVQALRDVSRCSNPLQEIIEASLVNLAIKANTNQFNISLKDLKLNNLVWDEEKKELTLKKEEQFYFDKDKEYTAEEIGRLLTYEFQDNKKIKIMIPYSLLNAEFSELTGGIFLEKLRVALTQCFQHDVSILLPICFVDSTTSNMPTAIWTLLCLRKSQDRGRQLVFEFIDPTNVALGKVVSKELLLRPGVPLEQQMKELSISFQAILLQLENLIASERISAAIQITQMGQIEINKWVDSGPLLIKNAKNLILDEPFLQYNVQILRQEQRKILKSSHFQPNYLQDCTFEVEFEEPKILSQQSNPAPITPIVTKFTKFNFELFKQHYLNVPPPSRSLKKDQKSQSAHIAGDGYGGLCYLGNGIVASASADDLFIRLWDIEKSVCIKELKAKHGPQCLDTFVDEKSGKRKIVSVSVANSLEMWDIETGDHKLFHNKQQVYTMCHVGGGKLALGNYNYKIEIFDTNSNTSKILGTHSNYIYIFKLLKNKWLVSGSRDKTIKVWDMTTERCIKILKGHTHFIRGLAETIDEKLVSASYDASLKLWDLELSSETACIDTLKEGCGNFYCLDSTSQGIIVSGDYAGKISVWDLARSRSSIRNMTTSSTVMDILAIDAYPGVFVSRHKNGEVRVWHLPEVILKEIKEELPDSCLLM